MSAADGGRPVVCCAQAYLLAALVPAALALETAPGRAETGASSGTFRAPFSGTGTPTPTTPS